MKKLPKLPKHKNVYWNRKHHTFEPGEVLTVERGKQSAWWLHSCCDKERGYRWPNVLQFKSFLFFSETWRSYNVSDCASHVNDPAFISEQRMLTPDLETRPASIRGKPLFEAIQYTFHIFCIVACPAAFVSTWFYIEIHMSLCFWRHAGKKFRTLYSADSTLGFNL